MNRAAQFLHLRHAGLDVLGCEVDRPGGRHALLRGTDPTVAAFAVHDHEIGVRPLAERLYGPSEETAVELLGRIEVGGVELVPAKRAGRVHQVRAEVRLRLPYREDRPLRILDDRHAADLEHVERRAHHAGAEALRPLGGLVGTADRDVGVPSRRRAGVAHHLGLRGDRRHLLPADECPGVGDAISDGRVIEVPAEQLRVEGLCGLLVRRGEVHPAEGPRRVLRALSHVRSLVTAQVRRSAG